jgi:hypothetical protein
MFDLLRSTPGKESSMIVKSQDVDGLLQSGRDMMNVIFHNRREEYESEES